VQQRYGRNIGVSVIPYRSPPLIYTSRASLLKDMPKPWPTTWLEVLANYWRAVRPTGVWMFPGAVVGEPISTAADGGLGCSLFFRHAAGRNHLSASAKPLLSRDCTCG
jgi:hypothetical protein